MAKHVWQAALVSDQPRRIKVAVCAAAVIRGIVLVAVGLAVWTVADRYCGRIYGTAEAVPERPAAVVFGAGYWPDGTPSDVMKERCTGRPPLSR